jgi:hypothetical protein
MQYTLDRTKIDKDDLKYLDEKIETMDMETKIIANLNNTILDNVNSDIMRRSTKSSELRKRREKERL